MAVAWDAGDGTRSSWRVWAERENVTFLRRTAPGVYFSYSLSATDGAVKRRAIAGSDHGPAGGYVHARRLRWLLPDENMPVGVVPAAGDAIVDAAAVRWTVTSVDTVKYGNSHWCEAVSFSIPLGVTGTLYRPALTQSVGRQALATYVEVGSSVCRVQPLGADATDVGDRRTAPRRYTAHLVTELAAKAKDRFTAGGQDYTVLAARFPEQLDTLPTLELEVID